MMCALVPLCMYLAGGRLLPTDAQADAKLDALLRVGMRVPAAERVLKVCDRSTLIVREGYCSRRYASRLVPEQAVELDIVPGAKDRWTVRAWRLMPLAEAGALAKRRKPVLKVGMAYDDAVRALDIWAAESPMVSLHRFYAWYACYEYPGRWVVVSVAQAADGVDRITKWSIERRGPESLSLVPSCLFVPRAVTAGPE